MKRSSHTLNATVFRLILIPAGVILLILAGVGVISVRLAFDELIAQQNLVIELIARQANSYLRETRALLETEAAFLAGLNPVEQKDLLQHTRQSYLRFTALYLLDQNGQVVMEEKPGTIPPLDDFDLSGETYFQEARSTRGTYFSETFFSLATNDVAVTIAVPLFINQQFQGELVAEMGLAQLQQTIQEMGTSDRNNVFIVDDRGTVVAYPNPEWVRQQVNLGSLEVVQKGKQKRTLVFYYDDDARAWLVGSAIPMENRWIVVTTRSLAEAGRPMFVLLIVSGLAFGASIILFSMLLNSVLKQITNPIRHLAEQAEAISQDVNTPLDDYTLPQEFSEITALMVSFGRMILRVNERTADLVESNRKLARELEEHHRAEEELNKYREHLEELVADRTAELQSAYRELETFSYSVSHDLRAPLRHIDGFSHILMDDYANQLDEQGKSFLQHIRTGTANMTRLIDGLLQLSRTTRGEMRIEQQVDLSEMAREVVHELQETDLEREVEWLIQPACVVQGDPRLLGALLRNLLGNAWKFSSRNERALIEFGQLPPAVASQRWETDAPVYFVKDNGVGFNMAHSQKLFTPFQRLHRENEFPGTGIGLATVQRIVQRHGGRIWVESQVGQGATFYFTL